MFSTSLVDVDAKELNAILSFTSGKENVDEEDDNHIQECDEADDNNSIEDEDETKHAVKPYFYNVIFWNMKYLFFFNCELLLLCCVCFKFAIQDFVQENKQKYMEKILTVSPTTIPTEWYPSVFHREFKKIYGIVPQSPTTISTDWHPSVFHRELGENYGIVPQSPMDSSTIGTHHEAHAC